MLVELNFFNLKLQMFWKKKAINSNYITVLNEIKYFYFDLWTTLEVA
jgi:hypothetical protein